MAGNKNLSMVSEIMSGFADLTGLSAAGKIPRRYLWTDAFAVCTFLGLYRQTGDTKYKELALRLVDQVHSILGRHREDNGRTGWISGLDNQEGKKHPTIGGLRIGKMLNERKRGDAFDESQEWDRDGQYYHYLAKWMHALCCVSTITGDASYLFQATELAKTAHARFTYSPPSGGRKRMYWKMSIDLSRPLVESMGHLDPLEGLVTYNQLKAAAKKFGGMTFPDLEAEIAEMSGICEGKSWLTDDPLGIGDLLLNVYKLAHLFINGNFRQPDLTEDLLDTSLQGLQYFSRSYPLNLPAQYRLAFREFGLSIGFHALQKAQNLIADKQSVFRKKQHFNDRIESLICTAPIAEIIEDFWLEPANRLAGTWIEHRDINMVMLATSLLPDGYLTL